MRESVGARASTAEETEDVGARVARAWPRGGTDPEGPGTEADVEAGRQFTGPAVIYLVGDLGAGKTTFARGFLRALGVQGAVRSPTYTLLEAYEVGAVTALHLDLYRLRDPAELDELGLREWAKADHLWLIEWPERGTGRLPAPDLEVTLSAAERCHDIQLTAHSALGQAWLANLRTT